MTDKPTPTAPDYSGLVTRLRYQQTEHKRIATECEAAAAIEALRAERDALRDVLKTTEGYERQANNRAEAAEARVRKLERDNANLELSCEGYRHEEKALREALEQIADPDTSMMFMRDIARNALAGGDDDQAG